MSFARDNRSWDALSPEATVLSAFAESVLFHSLTITTKYFAPLNSPTKLLYYAFKGIFFAQNLN